MNNKLPIEKNAKYLAIATAILTVVLLAFFRIAEALNIVEVDILRSNLSSTIGLLFTIMFVVIGHLEWHSKQPEKENPL